MERRDFFGIIAAPLLRQFTPPEPECAGLIPPNLPAMVHSHDNVLPPLSVKALQEALAELKRQQDADGVPILLSGAVYIYPPRRF